MKNFKLFISLLIFTSIAKGQTVNSGWYYFKNPMSNAFGIAYNEPKDGNDLSYAGSNFQVNDSNLMVLKGPDQSLDLRSSWKQIVLTSVFHKSTNISITVRTYNLKRVIFPGKLWQSFTKENYYVVEALRADSVFITGKIIDTTTTDSKDLETIISTLATSNTAAFKVVSALTKKDSTSKNNGGIISYKTAKKDSFSIIIKQPDVYFAAKFVKNNPKARDYWNAPLSAPYKSETNDFKLSSGNNFELFNYHIDNIDAGLTLIASFIYDDKQKKATVQISEQKTGDAIKPIYSDIKEVRNDVVNFDYEYPVGTEISSTGHFSAKKYLTLIDYKLIFNSKTNSLSIYGYQTVSGQSTYQTCIYQIKEKFKFWPK